MNSWLVSRIVLEFIMSGLVYVEQNFGLRDMGKHVRLERRLTISLQISSASPRSP